MTTTRYTITMEVPPQAVPATLTVELDPADYDSIETLMIAAIHADAKTGHYQPGAFTHEDGEIDIEFCLGRIFEAALPTHRDFTVTIRSEETKP